MLFGVVNLEWRRRVKGAIGLSFFVDGGNAWRDPSHIRLEGCSRRRASTNTYGLDDVHWAGGVGVHLITPGRSAALRLRAPVLRRRERPAGRARTRAPGLPLRHRIHVLKGPMDDPRLPTEPSVPPPVRGLVRFLHGLGASAVWVVGLAVVLVSVRRARPRSCCRASPEAARDRAAAGQPGAGGQERPEARGRSHAAARARRADRAPAPFDRRLDREGRAPPRGGRPHGDDVVGKPDPGRARRRFASTCATRGCCSIAGPTARRAAALPGHGEAAFAAGAPRPRRAPHRPGDPALDGRRRPRRSPRASAARLRVAQRGARWEVTTLDVHGRAPAAGSPGRSSRRACATSPGRSR